MRVNLFPSPVVYRECLPHPKMVEWIKEYQKNTPGVEASSTGWHSPYDLHTDEGFTMYFLWFYSQVAAAVEELTPNQFDIQSMWAIVNGPGDSNVAHQHPGSDLSAVMWLETPPSSGKFIFENDAAITRYKLIECVPPVEKDQWNFHDYTWFEPKPWSLLLFPADMRHRVERNESTEQRISIAANIKLR